MGAPSPRGLPAMTFSSLRRSVAREAPDATAAWRAANRAYHEWAADPSGDRYEALLGAQQRWRELAGGGSPRGGLGSTD